jgi:hypothetical protein
MIFPDEHLGEVAQGVPPERLGLRGRLGKHETQASSLSAIDFAANISASKNNLIRIRNELQELVDKEAGVAKSADVGAEINTLLQQFDAWSLDKTLKRRINPG